MIVKQHISVEQCALHVSMEIFDSGETSLPLKKPHIITQFPLHYIF